MERACYSIDEFCEAFRISRRTFYRIIEDGRGPRTMKIRGKVLISVEAAKDWVSKLEAEADEQAANG